MGQINVMSLRLDPERGVAAPSSKKECPKSELEGNPKAPAKIALERKFDFPVPHPVTKLQCSPVPAHFLSNLGRCTALGVLFDRPVHYAMDRAGHGGRRVKRAHGFWREGKCKSTKLVL